MMEVIPQHLHMMNLLEPSQLTEKVHMLDLQRQLTDLNYLLLSLRPIRSLIMYLRLHLMVSISHYQLKLVRAFGGHSI